MASKAQKHQSKLLREQPVTAQERLAVDALADAPALHDLCSSTEQEKCPLRQNSWLPWFHALKQIFPLYLATHLAFFVITCLGVLFMLKDFSWQALPISTLWNSWYHWDSSNFTTIARSGYTSYGRTAFFPLYPLLERGVMYATNKNPFIAGLIVSNLAGLGIFVILYRLIGEDFNAEQAERAVLYLALFPTAFYLASGYNESLFLFLSVLTFYHLRHGNWWWAGCVGLLASLTRSVGIVLVVAFSYEYLRQHQFRWKALHVDAFAGALIPGGMILFALWCFIQYHDPLAFSHAQANWNRYVALPGYGIILSIQHIHTSSGLLSFQALRNMTDLLPDLFILLFIILSFVGPWRLPRQLWVYGIYAILLYTFLQLFPKGGTGLFPLESVGRYLLEVFPAFIVMAAVGKHKTFHFSYLLVSGAVLFFLLTQFLVGHWVV